GQLPGPGAVGGAVDAVARIGVLAGVWLAGADPDGVVSRVHRHCPDEQVVLLSEDRLPGPAAVGGLPDTTGRRPGVQGAAVHGERGHPAPYQPRAAAGVGPDRVTVAQGVGVVGLVGDLLPAATALCQLARRPGRRGESGRAD